jgi:hypothetical protein
VINSLIESEDSVATVIPLAGVQVVFRLATMFSVFLLVSGTFVFRYGLLGALLERFKLLMWIMPLSFVVAVIFRVLRVVAVLGNKKVIKIWDNPTYQALYGINAIGKEGRSGALRRPSRSPPPASVFYYVTTSQACFQMGENHG